jgi:hypothetical protein
MACPYGRSGLLRYLEGIRATDLFCAISAHTANRSFALVADLYVKQNCGSVTTCL